jgi:hypothetical protein
VHSGGENPFSRHIILVSLLFFVVWVGGLLGFGSLGVWGCRVVIIIVVIDD